MYGRRNIPVRFLKSELRLLFSVFLCIGVVVGVAAGIDGLISEPEFSAIHFLGCVAAHSVGGLVLFVTALPVWFLVCWWD